MIPQATTEGFRLSPRQRALWLAHADGSPCHAQCAVAIDGDLRADELRAALERSVARHEILRTTFRMQPGVRVPLQVIAEETAIEWRTERLAGAEALERRLARERDREFDLDRLPVVRALLLDLAGEGHLLALTLPALVADGRTLRNLLDDVSRSYGGEALTDEPLQYADFAEWQHELLAGEESDATARAEAVRREALALEPPRLPFERPGAPDDRTFAAGAHRLELPAGLATRLAAFAAAHGTPPAALLFVTWQGVLARFSGGRDLRLFCLFEGRGYEELEGGFGPYARWLSLPCRVHPAEPVGAAADRVRSQLDDAADWQHYTLDGEPDGLAGEVLFEHAELPAAWAADGARLAPRGWSVCAERFKLKLCCRGQGEALTAEVQFDRRRLAREDVAYLARAYVRMLEGALDDPAARIADLEIVAPSESAREPAVAGSAGSAEAPFRTVLRRFEEQAARTHAAPALAWGGAEISYAALDASARRLARRLCAAGAGPGAVVAVLLERSAAVVEAMLAAWKAGAAFSVLEPGQPARRLASMLGDLAGRAGALFVVGSRELLAALPAQAGVPEARRLCLDRPEEAPDDGREEPAAEDPEEDGGALAYVVFTSGSTGRPKGVAVEHRHLAAYLDGALECLDLPAGGRYVSVSTFAADLGHTTLFPALTTGGCLHIVAQEHLADAGALASELGDRPGDCLKIVPSHLQALLAATGDARFLPRERLVLGGEACGWGLVERVRELAPGCRVFNHYGPSETTVGVIAGELGPAMGDAGEASERHWPPPLGRPLAAARIYLLDERLRPVPAWVSGHLHVGGQTVARGYFGRPALTAEAFVPDPFAGREGSRMYRTGDLARRRPDGRIDFLGRSDDQVKVHGFRVELEEVRGALERHSLVLAAAVRLVPGDAGPEGDQLVAYYASPAEIPPGDLRRALGESLPVEILPNAFVRLDRLPLTANGKVDFAAFPSLEEAQSQSRGERLAPRTPTEETLGAIWAEALGRSETPGVLDNFFELGGHSLLATQLMARVCEVFRVTLPLRVLLESPTIAALATAIARKRAAGGDPEPAVVLPELTPDPASRHLRFPLTEVQQAYWLGRSGAFELGGVSTHSYMEIDSAALDLERLERALRRVIDRHEMLRAVVLPDGTQRILERVPPYEIAVLDLRGLGGEDLEARLGAERERLSHSVQSPEVWPLFDVRATRMDGGRVRLHVSRDALIFDAWSALLFFRDLFRFYSEPETDLPPLDVSYRDYVLAEERLRETELYRRDLDYWRRRIPELPPAPELPLAVDPASLEEPRFGRRSGTLPAAAWARLKERAAGAGLTPSGLVLAAYADVLALWSKSPRFTLNLTLFHRLPFHPQVQEVVGDFTSLTLLEVDGSVPAPFALRARRLQERLWEDLEHRHVSGVRVQRELARHRRRTGAALAPVVLTSTLALDLTFREETLRGMAAELGYGLAITSQVWLDHSASEQEDGSLVFHWNAVEALFPDGMLDSMFGAYARLLERLAGDDAVWLEEGRPWLSESELLARRAANDTSAPLPEGRLHEPFFRRAARRPDDPAVLDSRRTLSYGELARLAERTGELLRARGARPNRLVAVVMEKGWEQVAAVLGVLVAGAAYLPIDQALPPERRRRLFAQGEAAIALTQPWLVERLEWPEDVAVVALGDDGPELVAGTGQGEPEDQGAEAPRAEPGDLAYVLFTSGSTGTPKGVMISHRAALNTVADVDRRFALGPADRVLALSSLGFDLSVWDLFGVLAAGGALVMPEPAAARDPGRWCELVAEHDVTLWNTVPALLEMLVEYAEGRPEPPALGSVRLALLSGDWIPLTLPARFRALAPEARVVSLGGATEASIWSILRLIDEVEPAWRSIPYGAPMANQRFHVLDERLEPRPTWVPGALYIAGDGLAEGYWRDEERTRASFFEHPGLGERLYRTGDVGRYLPDGEIEFLGREDHQVKVQGHRIELGEIESALEKHPEVGSAVVAAPGERGNRRLVAYVVARRGPDGLASPGVPAPAPLPPSPACSPEPIDDPVARLRFKLGEPGLRRDLAAPGIALARPESGDEAVAARYLERRSHRRFLAEPLPVERLGRLLDALSQARLPGWPIAKYRYASASGLYPVQTYLYVKPGRVAGLAAGAYYLDPRGHRLVPLAPASDELGRDAYSPINRPVFDRSAFALFLVARMAAIEPLYGEPSRHYVAIEAGLMTQLLETSAPGEGIGLCQIGGLDFDRLRPRFALYDDHVLVHSLLGGATDPEARSAFDADPAELALIESLRGETATAPEAAPAARSEADLGEALRAFVGAKLPAYMVPPTVVFLDALPLTDNGKVDRAALPAPETAEESAAPAVVPSGATEEAIAEIWRQVLAVDEVGSHDNFFDLGGSSIGMVQVHSRLTAVLGRDLPVTELFRYPTIAGLARSLDAADDGDTTTDAAVAAGRDLATRQRREIERRRRRAQKGPASD